MKFINNEHHLVFQLEGHLIMSNSDQVKNKIKEKLNEHKSLLKEKPVILDFQSLEFLDSTGIGVIISVFKYLNENKGHLKVINAQGPVKKIMEITKLDSIVSINQN